MDNLFTSARLLVELKKQGFGAAGTVRTTKAAGKTLEEKYRTIGQKDLILKEVDRGLNLTLSDLKLRYTT